MKIYNAARYIQTELSYDEDKKEYHFQTKENPNAKGMWYEDWLPGGKNAGDAAKAFEQFYKKAGGV